VSSYVGTSATAAREGAGHYGVALLTPGTEASGGSFDRLYEEATPGGDGGGAPLESYESPGMSEASTPRSSNRSVGRSLSFPRGGGAGGEPRGEEGGATTAGTTAGRSSTTTPPPRGRPRPPTTSRRHPQTASGGPSGSTSGQGERLAAGGVHPAGGRDGRAGPVDPEGDAIMDEEDDSWYGTDASPSWEGPPDAILATDDEASLFPDVLGGDAEMSEDAGGRGGGSGEDDKMLDFYGERPSRCHGPYQEGPVQGTPVGGPYMGARVRVLSPENYAGTESTVVRAIIPCDWYIVIDPDMTTAFLPHNFEVLKNADEKADNAGVIIDLVENERKKGKRKEADDGTNFLSLSLKLTWSCKGRAKDNLSFRLSETHELPTKTGRRELLLITAKTQWRLMPSQNCITN
ncbi:hypothetical protein THAOC_24973, partial [Thalassiosira oceanica]